MAGFASGATAVAAGTEPCLLTDAGAVECWLTDGANSLPKPVTGATSGVVSITSGGGSTESASEVTQVVGLTSGVTTISMGNSFACAVTADARVVCWGLNNLGQLGATSTATCNPSVSHPCSPVPLEVTGLPARMRSVSAGGSNACAVTLDGAVFCWGSNTSGIVNDGTHAAITSAPNSGAKPLRRYCRRIRRSGFGVCNHRR